MSISSWVKAATALGALLLHVASAGADAERSVLGPADLAVIVNDADPLSLAIADYYQRQRRVPSANMIHVSMDPTRASISSREFAALRQSIDARVPENIQVFALTWMKPYRVECMSITTALAAGFDTAFCSTGCTSTRWSPYFNADSRRPHDDFGWRPAMSIAATSLEDARALIDRGVASDGATDPGSAYLVSTDDPFRNIRARSYRDAALMAGDRVRVEIVRAQQISRKPDVMFYFTGLARVADVETNRFLPGAVADHLTSFGGDLAGALQMSSLRWLQAGATGSYGTVTEPCNLSAKFPNVGMMMRRYLAGETLIEAYWKSVAMPGQGLFIGEPLARPFGIDMQRQR